MKNTLHFPSLISGLIVGAILVLVGYRVNDMIKLYKSQNPVQKQATTTIGKAPILGDKNKAKVAIIEFGDFECPYCQKFHTEVFDQITKKYVDAGKIIIVFKNFPLEFHKPAAQTEANAALCVNELGGGEKFFEMVKQIYINSSLNGKGASNDKIIELAVGLGLDRTQFSDCLSSNKFDEQISKDIAEGKSAGVTGTPSFVIGVIKDGNVNGDLVVGASTFETFQKIIDKQLRKNLTI